MEKIEKFTIDENCEIKIFLSKSTRQKANSMAHNSIPSRKAM